MNFFRGDIHRLTRQGYAIDSQNSSGNASNSIENQTNENENQTNENENHSDSSLKPHKIVTPRCKPLRYVPSKPLNRRLCYQKEIVLYAHFKKLLYFSIECSYAKFGYRGNSNFRE